MEEADDYLKEISPLVAGGVAAERERWLNKSLTRHDGLITGKVAVNLLRDRFDLEKLIYFGLSVFWRGAVHHWKSTSAGFSYCCRM